jgi:hypothetical protein
MLRLMLCELEGRYEDSFIICYDKTIQQLNPNYAPALYYKGLMLQNYNGNNNNEAAKRDVFWKDPQKNEASNYSSRKQENELGLELEFQTGF